MVEQIEELGAKLQPPLFPQGGQSKAAAESEIHVPKAGAAKRVAWRVSDRAIGGRAELGLVEQNHSARNLSGVGKKGFVVVLAQEIGAVHEEQSATLGNE